MFITDLHLVATDGAHLPPSSLWTLQKQGEHETETRSLARKGASRMAEAASRCSAGHSAGTFGSWHPWPLACCALGQQDELNLDIEH